MTQKFICKWTFTFWVAWRVHSSFASLSVSFGSSLLLKFFYQSELLSCKWREMKQTNISWPVTKVKETSSTGLEIYNAVRIILLYLIHCVSILQRGHIIPDKPMFIISFLSDIILFLWRNECLSRFCLNFGTICVFEYM